MKALLALLAVVVALIGGSIWSGYVLSVLWGWFAVPAFHLAPISIPLAIGITMIIRMLTYEMPQSQDKKSDTATALASLYGWGFLYPLFILGMGAVVHSFV